MTLDASLQNPLGEATPHRPVWSALTRWWSPSAPSNDAELGYESALPWTLHEDRPAETGDSAY